MHSVNNELVKAGHDFAAAISNDTPIIEIAKMVANLATALDDRTREVTAYEATVTNLTAQVRELTAKNSDLIRAHKSVLSVTDAALAEMRAQGVDMFAAETIRIGEEEQDEDIIYAGKQAQLYAQQLRKEQGK